MVISPFLSKSISDSYSRWGGGFPCWFPSASYHIHFEIRYIPHLIFSTCVVCYFTKQRARVHGNWLLSTRKLVNISSFSLLFFCISSLTEGRYCLTNSSGCSVRLHLVLRRYFHSFHSYTGGVATFDVSTHLLLSLHVHSYLIVSPFPFSYSYSSSVFLVVDSIGLGTCVVFSAWFFSIFRRG